VSNGFSLAGAAFLTQVALFLVVWFTIMAVTGWLAGRKRRGSGNWAFAALFTGPLALLLVLLLPRGTNEPERDY
jgi:hypothetical protein